MDKYAYLILAMVWFVAALALIVVRTDLAPKAAKIAVIGAVAGAVAELFYFSDYWRPPTLLGKATISIEDIIAGAGIVVLSYAAYPVLFKVAFSSVVYPARKKEYGSMFLISIIAMAVAVFGLHLNSVLIGALLLLILTIIVAWQRPDLLRVIVWSACIVTTAAFVVYGLIFNLLVPHYWDTYWLLARTNLGLTVLGVPATEIVWYATWSAFASASYPFVSGKALAARNK